MSNHPAWMAGHLPPTPPPRRPGLLRRIADAIGGYTTYCCPEITCDVRVRVRGLEPGEARRYQELAADHSQHRRKSG
ncbi:hypothetical protein GCM10009760_53220 [Kitasatospora kazusensis]|uniref:Uncharacterized protein n=1 Tax=Kitasatospora kazusensis TaxID=407974 RepID=A0ABP5M003_9ACTN